MIHRKHSICHFRLLLPKPQAGEQTDTGKQQRQQPIRLSPGPAKQPEAGKRQEKPVQYALEKDRNCHGFSRSNTAF